MAKETNNTKRLSKKDGTVIYVRDNKLHNWEGPALIPEGNMRKAEYYLFGIQYSKDEWIDRMKDSDGLPFYKTAAGKVNER